MVLFIIALYALEHFNCVLNGRLVNSYRLETSFKCAVLFNVLSVLLKGSSAYYLQLATAESRLQDIGGVHGRAFAVPCTNNIVYLVDEEDGTGLREETVALGALYHVAHVLHAAGHGTERIERSFQLVGDNLRQGCLSHSRRTP